MSIIYKYLVRPIMRLRMPSGVSRFLHVAETPNDLVDDVFMWWLFENEKAEEVEKHFFAVPTGRAFEFNPNASVYLGTFRLSFEGLVFHLFEARDETNPNLRRTLEIKGTREP